MKASVTIDNAAIRRVMEDQGGTVDRYLLRLTNDVAREVRANAPVKTGKLRSNIVVVRKTQSSRAGYSVIADTEYAMAVVKGTRPHVILPKQGKVLRFPSKGGGIIYTTKVDHPGTAPNPFMDRALVAVVRR